MTLQVVLSDKALATAIALELTISKMCLDVRADVFASAENLATILVQTCPLVRSGVLLADVPQDLFWSNTSVFNGCIHVEIVEACGLLVLINIKWGTVCCH